jgi:hypothetical protein
MSSNIYQTGPGGQYVSYSVGTKISFSGIKWPMREINISPPYSAEVRNKWSYISTPPIILCCLNGENMTFYYQFRQGHMMGAFVVVTLSPSRLIPGYCFK